MSILFTPGKIGSLELKNRFIFSACEDGAATMEGMITDSVIKRYRLIAMGDTGMIISSHLSVHPRGRTRMTQPGIYNNNMIPGLEELADTVHGHGAKIIFQLGHAGVQGPYGEGPSGKKAMDEDAICGVVESFIAAAGRAVEAGADGVQVHAAHGYLVNEFLSPFYNKRTDSWGGSKDNCFRLLGDIVSGIRKILPLNMALLVKLNSCDHTPEEGVTPELAGYYAGNLAVLGVDGLEVSCGTSISSPWNMCRGDVPVDELLLRFPEEQRPVVEKSLRAKAGNFALYESYNLDAAAMMRPVEGDMVVFPVGGWRNLPAMEGAVARGDTEFISICRPLIREPFLVSNFRQGKAMAASCTGCNRCLAALANGMPVRCYGKGF